MLQRNGTTSGANGSSTPQLALLAKARTRRRRRCLIHRERTPSQTGTVECRQFSGGGLLVDRSCSFTVLPSTSVSPYRCPTHRSPAATAVLSTSRRIIRSGPTLRTASTLMPVRYFLHRCAVIVRLAKAGVLMHRHFRPIKFPFGDTCRSQADSDYHPNPNLRLTLRWEVINRLRVKN